MAKTATEPYWVDPATECWIWQRGTSRGYGYTYRWVGGRKQGMGAHVFYYELAHGTMPEGLEIDHLCRNTLCVNPAHLEAVTRTENVRRSRATRLTVDQVREIRRREGTATVSALAREYGVARATIGRIFNRKNWRDVD